MIGRIWPDPFDVGAPTAVGELDSEQDSVCAVLVDRDRVSAGATRSAADLQAELHAVAVGTHPGDEDDQVGVGGERYVDRDGARHLVVGSRRAMSILCPICDVVPVVWIVVGACVCHQASMSETPAGVPCHGGVASSKV